MDLVTLAKSKIEQTGEGEHVEGLISVLTHIEVAIAHLDRGQRSFDDSAFTDAIYRTNQAYEGANKESYRVLSGKDPSKISLYDVEKYLTKHGSLKKRVLTLFENYRTEWRNPSAHDYKLDFNAAEALLAITSVSAFSILLLDQIIEHLSRNAEKTEKAVVTAIAVKKDDSKDSEKLLDTVVSLLSSYIRLPRMGDRPFPRSESELLGRLSGFLSRNDNDMVVRTDVDIGDINSIEADLLVSLNNRNIVVEIKRHIADTSVINNVMLKIDKANDSVPIEGAVILATTDSMFVSYEKRESPKGIPVVVISDKGGSNDES